MRLKNFVLCLVAGTAMVATAYAAAMSRNEALAVFKEATTTYAKFCTAGPNDAATLPETMEDRTGNALSTAENVLTKGDDTHLLNALIDYIDASDCSADESRAFALGAIFHKRPDASQTAIAALSDEKRCRLVGQLDWGWQNEIYGKTLDSKLKADREKRLKTLKASLPASCKEDKQ